MFPFVQLETTQISILIYQSPSIYLLTLISAISKNVSNVEKLCDELLNTAYTSQGWKSRLSENFEHRLSQTNYLLSLSFFFYISILEKANFIYDYSTFEIFTLGENCHFDKVLYMFGLMTI